MLTVLLLCAGLLFVYKSVITLQSDTTQSREIPSDPQSGKIPSLVWADNTQSLPQPNKERPSCKHWTAGADIADNQYRKYIYIVQVTQYTVALGDFNRITQGT